MSNITKTMMSVDLEFIDPTAHGFIKWVDLDGTTLSTLGLGSTAKKVDDNGNVTSTGGKRYLEWNLAGVDFIKITGGGIQFDEQRSLAIDSYKPVYNEYGDISGQQSYISSQIELNNVNYKDIALFEPANIVYKYIPDVDGVPQTQNPRYLELKQIKTNYKNNTNALILEHENAIAFTNPVTKRLMGLVDTINEAFVWYGAFSLGAVVADSLFEIKRTDTKYNFTLNASTGLKPEIGFKYEDILLWSINITTNNLNLKNKSGWGIELKNNENSVSFTGEILYKNQTLDDRYYTQAELDAGALDVRYYTEVELDGGKLDTRYYTKVELDAGKLDTRYYLENEVDIIIENSVSTAKTELHDRINELEKSVDIRYNQFFVYKNGEWIDITDTMLKIDEYEDRILITPVEGDIIFSEAENRYYNNLWQQQIIDTIVDIDDMPWVLKVDDLCIDSGRVYKWNGSSWIIDNLQNVEDYYTTALHLSSINNPVSGKTYKITSTGKFYKYINGKFTLSQSPIPDVTYPPNQYSTANKIVRFYRQ